MSTAATPTTMRTFALSHLLLSLTVVFMLGAMQVPDIEAKRRGNHPLSIQQRVNNLRKACEDEGGTLSTRKSPFGGNIITTCEGGDQDGDTCVVTKKDTYCNEEIPLQAPQSPLIDVGAPPSDGGIEDPTRGGGGADPGAGGGIDPGWGADPGGSDGGVILTSYEGGKHGKVNHQGKRQHHRRGDRPR